MNNFSALTRTPDENSMSADQTKEVRTSTPISTSIPLNTPAAIPTPSELNITPNYTSNAPEASKSGENIAPNTLQEALINPALSSTFVKTATPNNSSAPSSTVLPSNSSAAPDSSPTLPTGIFIRIFL